LERVWRSNKKVIARRKVGMNGTKSRNIFDIKWGMIMALSRPSCLVSQGAVRHESAAMIFTQKKSRPSEPSEAPKRR
jgi:hypothetical protein